MNISNAKFKLSKQIAIIVSSIVVCLAVLAPMAQAGPYGSFGLNETAYEAKIITKADGSSAATIPQIIGGVVQAILGLLGVIFLIQTVYSGVSWMMAGGNEETITKAKSTIQLAIIGLIICLSAYGITYFVLDSFQAVTLTGS